ncbi:hypothetical protein [Streptomyces brevispora]|uniref:hypothetical protein n=1 Tax=Streptomyces brevispora TaxID=887462 RepID=UPI0011A036EA|nr:hypothetical protein [Streptomyces brevispora]
MVGLLLQTQGIGAREAALGERGGVHDRLGGVEGAPHSQVGGLEAVGVVGPCGQGELGACGRGELMGEDVGDLGQDDASVVAPGVQGHGDEQGLQADGAGASGVGFAGALLCLVEQGDDAGAFDELAGAGEVGGFDVLAAFSQLVQPWGCAGVVVREWAGVVGGGHGISLRMVWACSAPVPWR